MKINLVSDLHLGFGPITLPGGDVLIMAGDIMEAKVFANKNGKAYKIFKDFIDEELAKYNHVLYVLGNHEHYGSTYQDTALILREELPSNVILLEKDSVNISGTIFYGATFWTNFNKDDYYAQQYAENRMNDFQHIKWNSEIAVENNNVEMYTTRFLPVTSMRIHEETMQDFRKFLRRNVDENIVVISHHAPSFTSVPDHFKGDFLNYAYASDLSEVILDNPNITHWVHGHMHHNNDYMIGHTHILSNPRGYKGYEVNKQFSPKFTFEV